MQAKNSPSNKKFIHLQVKHSPENKKWIFVQVNVVPNFSFAGNHIHLEAKSGLVSSLQDVPVDPVHKHNSNLNASLHDGEIDGGDVAKGELWIRLQPRLLRITEPKKPETW